MAKTPTEIAALKASWLANSETTHLEDTPGFEDHHLELKAWREAEEAKLSPTRIISAEKEAVDLGCSVALTKRIQTLEAQVRILMAAATP